jgi:hypothetical protein
MQNSAKKVLKIEQKRENREKFVTRTVNFCYRLRYADLECMYEMVLNLLVDNVSLATLECTVKVNLPADSTWSGLLS